MDKKTITTALCGVLAGGLIFAGGFSFAGDQADTAREKFAGKPFFGQGMKMGGMMKNKGHFKGGRQMLSQETLAQLVQDGVLTQEKADAVKEFQALKGKMRTENSGTLQVKVNFDELVTNKILTQEQADNVQDKIREMAHEEKQQKLSENLRALVEKGTITQEQSDQVLKSLEDAHKRHEELFEKTKDMTREERRQFMQENKEQFKNPMSQLVDGGTITEEQARAMGGGFGHRGFRGGWR